MKSEKQKPLKGYVWSSILLMSGIFGLHILLVIGLVLLVIIFQGFLEYTLWIFLGGIALILCSGFWIWSRLKKRKESMGDTLNNPTFQGRDVEVSFMGGAVNLRLGARNTPRKGHEALQGGEGPNNLPELEDRDTVRVRELKELSRLMEKGVITEEEYQSAKKRLLSD